MNRKEMENVLSEIKDTKFQADYIPSKKRGDFFRLFYDGEEMGELYIIDEGSLHTYAEYLTVDERKVEPVEYIQQYVSGPHGGDNDWCYHITQTTLAKGKKTPRNWHKKFVSRNHIIPTIKSMIAVANGIEPEGMRDFETNALSSLVDHMKDCGIEFLQDNAKLSLDKANAVLGGNSIIRFVDNSEDGISGYVLFFYNDNVDRDLVCGYLGKNYLKNEDETYPYKVSITIAEIEKMIHALKDNSSNIRVSSTSVVEASDRKLNNTNNNSIRIGRFYSWEIITDEVAVKTGDKTLVEVGETGIPQEIYGFFECDNLEKGEIKDIELIYQNNNYSGVIRRKQDDIGRIHMSWRGELHNRLKSEYSRIDDYPTMVFRKSGLDAYEIALEYDSTILKDDNSPDESEEWLIGTEGKKKVIYTTKYERNPKLRRQAILIHGFKCEVCGFDFEKVYGALGKDFIEVHHIKPLSERGEECMVDPTTDLICLCSNCHRMIHRNKGHVLTPDELKSLLRN